jgi:hypothetical protein
MKRIVKGKLLIRLAILIIVAVIGFQLIAKFYLGLGSLPLYITHPKYEYIYAPNQNLYRFHNHIVTNEFSMRSKPLSKKDRLRILKIGDSVINGGAHVDQDNLSSSQLEKKLQIEFKDSVRVLNISAQSWGPDNAFAYIKENGNFNSKFFVLVFSSHDLHDNMHFKPVVGEHKAWPKDQPLCAFTDGFSRYFVPKVKSWFGSKDQEYDYLFDFDDSKLNPGWQQFFDYCKSNQIQLLVYVHATRSELKAKSYDKYGLQLIDMLKENNVLFIEGLNQITDTKAYRDEIHLNALGHDQLSDALYPYLQAYCKANL